ncbi:MAG: acyl-CoA reductase [Flavobacteriales bacterium]
MINLSQRIQAFHNLGNAIGEYIDSPESEHSSWLRNAVHLAGAKNGWFTEREVHHALKYWSNTLKTSSLQEFVNDYTVTDSVTYSVGLIMAGNIPMVGFHDVLCVLLSGNSVVIKCSTSDDVLIPALLHKLTEIEPDLQSTIKISTGKLEGYDAVIATGSNNTARHFEYYFSRVPHIIRKNRTGIAVLNGDETMEELEGLMEDCFRYYGLGCRNVTKLYLPANYDLNRIFEASLPFSYLMDNKKYANNHTYYKALMMLERKPFLENDLIVLHESESLYSPVSILNYEIYQDQDHLTQVIESQLDQLQCVVGHKNRPFGTAQRPELNDFADGVNTLYFLSNLAAQRLPN